MNASLRRPLPQEDEVITLSRNNEVAERRLRERFPPETSPLPTRLQQAMNRLKAADNQPARQ
jgi:hypothetical protein